MVLEKLRVDVAGPVLARDKNTPRVCAYVQGLVLAHFVMHKGSDALSNAQELLPVHYLC